MERKLVKCITFFISLFWILGSYAQPNTTLSLEDSSQQMLDLSGYKWRFKMMAPGEGVKKGFISYLQKILKP